MALLSYIQCSQHILSTVIVSTRWDLPSHFYTTFVSYSECAPLKLWYIALDWGVENQWNVFYLLFSATSVCLVLSNLPSLKEVIRSNMQYKNTICSHCQHRDETNLLSIYSGKVIGTVEFHKGLGKLIDNCLFSGAYIQHSVGKLEQDLRFYFKDYSSFSLATIKIGSLSPLLIDYSDVLHPGLRPVH